MVISKMPAQVKTVLRTLEEAGFAAYLVGGCVRDSLMGQIGRASCRERV